MDCSPMGSSPPVKAGQKCLADFEQSIAAVENQKQSRNKKQIRATNATQQAFATLFCLSLGWTTGAPLLLAIF